MKLALLAAVTAIAVATTPASAAQYLLHYTGVSDATTATVRISTTNTAVGGSYTVLSASGNVNGDVITTLVAPNPPGFNTDNLYYNADPIFDPSGIAFTSATTTYNLWGNSPGSYSLYGTTNGGGSYVPASDVGTLSVTAVPEPAVWGLMIVGFGMTGFAARRRSVAVTA